jgi:vitamin B12 transporter
MRTRHLGWALVIVLSLTLWAPWAAGQQAPAEPEQRLEEVVVTASRIPEDVSKTAADVTVITRQELEQREVHTVAEALRSVPALNVVQSGTPGSVTSVFARGGNSSHTLVLIDGVRVNSPTNGLFDFANLTTEGVERIEIVRGPTSALYGSDGLTAVINIISRKGEGTPRGSVRGEFGSYQTFRERAESSGGLGPVRYSVDVAREDSSGKFAHDEYNNTSGAVRLDSQVAAGLSLDLSARYTHGFKNLPPVPGRTNFLTGLPDPTQSSREDFATVSLGATHKATSWWDHRLQLSLVDDDVDFRDPQQPTSTSDTETTRLAGDWQHNLRLVPWDTLTLGFQVDRAKGEQTDVSGATVMRKTITNYAFYGQNQTTLWERLILAAGVRADENSAFGTHTSPKFSAAFLVKETGSKLRASYGEGFRAPSINDLAFPGFSNPNLKPEKNRNLEFGIDQALWQNRIRASVTWFQSRFRDLIQASSGPLFIPVNIAHARTQGVEATLGFHPGFGVDVVGGYTYLETLDQDRNPLLRRPANTWNLVVNYAPWNRVNLNSSLLYVGKRDDIDPVTFGRTVNFKYVKWDAGVSVTVLNQIGVLRKLTAYGKLENILGVRYQEALGFPALGRSYLIGLSGEF